MPHSLASMGGTSGGTEVGGSHFELKVEAHKIICVFV
jgi:hypothetical protein